MEEKEEEEKHRQKRLKRSSWPTEITKCPIAIDLSQDGRYITCKICLEAGLSIDKYRVSTRHTFGVSRFNQHVNTVQYHKDAVVSSRNKAKQVKLNKFFKSDTDQYTDSVSMPQISNKTGPTTEKNE